jgi:hypothetical protein
MSRDGDGVGDATSHVWWTGGSGTRGSRTSVHSLPAHPPNPCGSLRSQRKLAEARVSPTSAPHPIPSVRNSQQVCTILPACPPAASKPASPHYPCDSLLLAEEQRKIAEDPQLPASARTLWIGADMCGGCAWSVSRCKRGARV